MFKIFFKYLDDFLVFWIDDLFIYSHTIEEPLKHLCLVDMVDSLNRTSCCSRLAFIQPQLDFLNNLLAQPAYRTIDRDPTNKCKAKHITILRRIKRESGFRRHHPQIHVSPWDLTSPKFYGLPTNIPSGP